jgi:glycosyltransferase involved in cell wall biosynthesis
MKLSIVIPVLDSHEVVKRQVLYWNTIPTDNCEIILVDDGSNPPIQIMWHIYIPIFIFRTHDTSPWSEHMATNLGISKARGEYIFKTDIDHIIPPESLDEALAYNGTALLRFKRKEAKINIRGEISDIGKERKPHSNTHVLKKSTFEKIGGYNEYGRGVGCGGSYDFRCRLGLHGIKEVMSENYVYVWPNSPITPTEDQHLFHNLRKTL